MKKPKINGGKQGQIGITIALGRETENIDLNDRWKLDIQEEMRRFHQQKDAKP